jgi:hypothetical protein
MGFRNRHLEVWERDNHVYLIFPKSPMMLYYVYRPLTYGTHFLETCLMVFFISHHLLS